MEALVLVGLGFVAAFASGLLGVGGAIVLIPLLRFVPPALGLPGYTMAEIAGISIVQVTVATLLGIRVHHRRGAIAWGHAAPMAIASGLGAGLGGAFSVGVPERVSELLFAALAVIAAVMMILPTRDPGSAPQTPKRASSMAVAGGVGVIAGVLGAGGAFLLAPLMRTVLGFPIRQVIGISLVVVLSGAAMGMLGKAVSAQVLWLPALLAVLGALPGAPLGAALSHRLDAKALRWALAILIALAALRMVVSAV
jgi:uncharacterized membrane protein YfcA